MPSLATWAPEDGVLGAVAPLALANAQPTALVVDLDPRGPAYPSERSLRQLVDGGPRAADLTPQRRGLAVLANGGVPWEAARQLVDLLVENWPAIVLRLPPRSEADVPAPRSPVRLLVPGGLFPPTGRGVFQRVSRYGLSHRPGPGAIVLPPAPRGQVAALLAGRQPAPSRWLRAWGSVWEATW